MNVTVNLTFVEILVILVKIAFMVWKPRTILDVKDVSVMSEGLQVKCVMLFLVTADAEGTSLEKRAKSQRRITISQIYIT